MTTQMTSKILRKLRGMSVYELQTLARKRGIKVKGRLVRPLFANDYHLQPTRKQYVEALKRRLIADSVN